MSEQRELHFAVHGHFYQPPRENPWTEEMPVEPSAAPFHDWNERIEAECYRPNAFARIVDDHGMVVAIVNNYSLLGFNVGPTLAAWLARHAPATYDRMVAADRDAGTAIAQAYHHPILPLATRRDMRTEIRWGLADFEHRFGRRAEGIWLPESAVNDEVLAVLVEEGVGFTILGPQQAAEPVEPGATAWWEHPDASGRRIALVFFDGPLSHDVAFGLASTSALPSSTGPRPPPPTAASWSWRPTVRRSVTTTPSPNGPSPTPSRWRRRSGGWAWEPSPAGWTSTRPPRRRRSARARGAAPTAWAGGAPTAGARRAGGRAPRRPGGPRCAPPSTSCATTSPRCSSGGARACSRTSGRRATRTCEVLLGEVTPEDFVAEHGWPGADHVEALTLLELQRQALLMYTSCGWFFHDLAGIETIQILRYAARALDLVADLGEAPPTEAFLDMLDQAESNESREGGGRQVWARHVVPARVGPERVVAHLRAARAARGRAARPGRRRLRGDRRAAPLRGAVAALCAGRAHLVHRRTRRTQDFVFAALHLGALDVVGACRLSGDPHDDANLVDALMVRWRAGDRLTAVLRGIVQDFGPGEFGLSAALPGAEGRILERTATRPDRPVHGRVRPAAG